MECGGVKAKAPAGKGEVGAGHGEKRQQGDAVGAAEAVEEVGDGVCRRQDGILGLGGLRSACTEV